MYVMDKGDVAGRDVTPEGAQKVVIIDINTHKIVRRIPIPASISNPKDNFLNDLAVDSKRGFLYISDSGNRSAPNNQSGIIVVNLKTGDLRRVLNAHD